MIKIIEYTMSNISVEPDTIVKLLRCGLQRGSGHQLTFANATAQNTYFTGRVLYSYTDFTYVRENNSIAVGQNVEDIRDCNYLMYQNKNFGNNKWFYAFITDLEYVNENCTRVYFETDSWQTWMYDFDLHPCWVDREHTNDDAVGHNIVPENLEMGEVICNGTEYYSGLDNLEYVIQVTKLLNDDAGLQDLATNYGGLPMKGNAYISYRAQDVATICSSLSTEGKADAVYNVYVVPRRFINHTKEPGMSPSYEVYAGDNAPRTDTKTINKPVDVNGLTVRNNKLLTYPYSYLLVSNNNGASNILKYENWSGGTCTFTIKGVPTVGGSIKIIPTSYAEGDEENGIMAGKFPTLNWEGDSYTNWLTQNATNLGVGIVSGGATTLTGAVMAGAGLASGGAGFALNGVTTAIGGATRIAQTIATDIQHQKQPPSASGNTNGGDINVCDSKNGFYFYKMSIRYDIAKVLDDYFTMYGYKTSELKYPNIGMTLNNVSYPGRENWNYVKTIGCTFDAKNSSKMSRQDEINIQQMFDNGVTLWHNPATMYDYSQSNNIVT